MRAALNELSATEVATLGVRRASPNGLPVGIRIVAPPQRDVVRMTAARLIFARLGRAGARTQAA